MKKKGISPLIATVLIIGFTVALAAIIITWSTGFTKKMQATTEETANIQVVCATDVVFDIKSVCATATSYKILIQNDGKESVTNWVIRFFRSENEVVSVDTRDLTGDFGVLAFGIKQLEITAPTTPVDYKEKVTKVEVFPIIQKGGKDIVCSQNVDSYGESTGSAMTLTSNPCGVVT